MCISDSLRGDRIQHHAGQLITQLGAGGQERIDAAGIGPGMHQHHRGIEPLGQLGQAHTEEQPFMQGARRLQQGEAVTGLGEALAQQLEAGAWIEIPSTQTPFGDGGIQHMPLKHI